MNKTLVIAHEPNKHYVEVDAKPFVIPGLEVFDFYLHPGVNGTGWTVSEKWSGLSVSGTHAHKTQKAAKEQAIINCNKCAPTIAKMFELIAKNTDPEIEKYHWSKVEVA